MAGLGVTIPSRHNVVRAPRHSPYLGARHARTLITTVYGKGFAPFANTLMTSANGKHMFICVCHIMPIHGCRGIGRTALIQQGGHRLPRVFHTIGVVVNLADARVNRPSIVLVGHTGTSMHNQRHGRAVTNLFEHLERKLLFTPIQPVHRSNEQAIVSSPVA